MLWLGLVGLELVMLVWLRLGLDDTVAGYAVMDLRCISPSL